MLEELQEVLGEALPYCRSSYPSRDETRGARPAA
jgi:hypothetical protein